MRVSAEGDRPLGINFGGRCGRNISSSFVSEPLPVFLVSVSRPPAASTFHKSRTTNPSNDPGLGVYPCPLPAGLPRRRFVLFKLESACEDASIRFLTAFFSGPKSQPRSSSRCHAGKSPSREVMANIVSTSLFSRQADNSRDDLFNRFILSTCRRRQPGSGGDVTWPLRGRGSWISVVIPFARNFERNVFAQSSSRSGRRPVEFGDYGNLND